MATDIFARLGDIKGESQDDKHKEEIEVFSFSWGMANPASGPGASGGRTTFQDLSIVHNVDKASPQLMQACVAGTVLKDATITQRKAGKGQHEFLVIKMNDIIVTSVTPSGAGGQSGSENVSLTFAKVDLEYKPLNSDGSPAAGIHFKYDFKTHKIG